MTDATRWFWVGSRDDVRAALESALGGPPVAGTLAGAGSRDLLIVDSLAGPADAARLHCGHVFAAVRALKEMPDSRVYVVVDEGDEIGPQLARFCLADGTVRWHAADGAIDLDELEEGFGRAGRARRPSVDELLNRIEREFEVGDGRENTVERLLRFESENTLLERLQDPETGLFDGPYATWKLDEEWKRAIRFHQPLSLILLDLGEELERLPDSDRRTVLVDAASVFLNECRDIDVLARFSPSTFLFLLPGTGTDGAEILATRMIESLNERLPKGSGLQLAAGVVTAPSSHIPDRKAFLTVAAACLQRAQSDGGGGQVATTWQ